MPVRRHARAIEVEDFPHAAAERPRRLTLRAREAIADEVVRIILVLFDVVPQPAADLRTADVEELPPRVLLTRDRIPRHDGGKRAECDAVAVESCCRELPRRHVPDERKP